MTVTMQSTAVLVPETSENGWIPGNRGIWVGITCELIEFTLMFVVYFMARWYYPEVFSESLGRLSTGAGLTITLCMLSSSASLATSVVLIRQGHVQGSRYALWLGLLLALCYPIAKVWEIRWNLAHGIDGDAGIFFGVYYYLTFNHLVHAGWGILGMVWCVVRHGLNGYSEDDHAGLEALACYWHATDMVWLIIFSLFYVLA